MSITTRFGLISVYTRTSTGSLNSIAKRVRCAVSLSFSPITTGAEDCGAFQHLLGEQSRRSDPRGRPPPAAKEPLARGRRLGRRAKPQRQHEARGQALDRC